MPCSRLFAPERTATTREAPRSRLLLVVMWLPWWTLGVPEWGWAQAPVSEPVSTSPPASVPLPSLEAPALAAPDAAASGGGAERSVGRGAQRGGDRESGDREDDGGFLPDTIFRVGARLMLGFEHESERSAGNQSPRERSEYGFVARQVRLRMKGELAGLFRANVSFDLADAFDVEAPDQYNQPPYLRNAHLEYRPSKAFRVRVGRFKRAFSHLELESASDLPILRRGLFNDELIEDNEWGDRALGIRVAGRLKAPRLRWYVSVTNPQWLADDTRAPQGLDVSARVEWTLIKRQLVLGANAAHKSISISGSEAVTGVAYGGDVTLDIGDAHFLLESNSAPRILDDGQRALGALLMAHYDWEVGPVWTLQPAVFVEYADADDQVLENESLRLAFALNALAYDGFRIMPQVDIVRSIGDTGADNPWRESETLTLIFSLLL